MADVWLEQMIAEIHAKELELANLKKAANTFYRSKGEPEPFTIDDPESATGGVVRVRPDEFYGKGFATAAGNYLERRKQAITADEVLRALEQGGFDFDALGWKEENRSRTVAMSLAKNTAIFHRLPSGTFGLKKWYGEAIEKKRARKSNGETEQAAETEEDK
jgi:hypothetical protein